MQEAKAPAPAAMSPAMRYLHPPHPPSHWIRGLPLHPHAIPDPSNEYCKYGQEDECLRAREMERPQAQAGRS